MYTTIKSFVDDYAIERQSTQKLLDALTDESLAQEALPGAGNWSIGKLAWHLVPSGGVLSYGGVALDPPSKEAAYPASAAEIAELYRRSAASVTEAVAQKWTDADLSKEMNLFGRTFTAGSFLTLFMKHEIHHRGQLTILMRLAGLPVAGVYGPSKDER
ncbi:DinB family protein [Paenibacillus protaetiae]|uniref:Damage-inducible protein DinB n=1 Tax=Paenibacillus protaetiae TaxID=2509456 RepID=A0A4V0YFG9_9BACL|nr:DinB family protein [Paenibacillus protaetiae]QAY67671.1 hypothetical protein ET464_16080 [Paenibacillus protaetiae]